MTPHREILWNVPAAAMTAVYVLSALSAVWIVYWFARRRRLWKQGHRSDDPPPWVEACARLVSYLLTHRTIRRDPFAGMMHALIFWGFVLLLIATTLVGIQHHLHLTFLTGNTYLAFSLGADLGGAAFCIGVGMALWRRRTATAHGRLLKSRATTWMLWLLLMLGVSGFLVEGARIGHDFPPFEVWSPVGYGTAMLLEGVLLDGAAATAMHRWVWMGHALLAIVFFAVIPVTLLQHILFAAYSVARPAGRPGVLSRPRPPSGDSGDAMSPDMTVGSARPDLLDFRQIDLLQADACLTCGRCNEVCPADAAGKPLQPRSVILGLREHLDHAATPLAQRVADDTLWSCTTCNACDTACPVNIHIVEKIVTMRRGRVAEAAIPAAAVDALESSAQKFNPFGRLNSSRMEWAAGLDVPVADPGEQFELLYWVGCAGAFDPAGREVTRAMVRILNHLGVDYRVLGCRERCTGDPARRLGEEELWQELAETNQQTIAAHGARTILTHCPHCLNSLRNEYPTGPVAPTVMHHSQWLRDRLDDNSLRLANESTERLTFHDPCYLARANDETEAPRRILAALSPDERVEMSASGTNGFCCGGGGGQLWLDVRGQTRVENIRASHVEQTGAQTVASACPFCRVMLEAGRTSLAEDQGKWRVKDIAELVVESLCNSQ